DVVDSERTLIEKLRGRDESAFLGLVEQYHGYLVPLANVFVSNRAVAEEVVQEAWLAVLKGIDRFEGRSSFKTWISRIVMNLARTRGVRESRMVAFSEFADEEAGGSEPAVDRARFRAATDEYPVRSDMIESGVIRRPGLRSLGALAKNPLAHVGRALYEFNALVFAADQEPNHRDVHQGDLAQVQDFAFAT